MIEVSIIIVTYNTKEMTLECINSVIEKTKDINYEIILVDNNSLDGSKELFSQDKRIIYIYNEKNYGFGIANNIGAHKAKGNKLFFLNSDTLLINNAIKYLSDSIDNDSSIKICGGNLYTEGHEPLHSFRRIRPGILDSLDIVTKKCISNLFWKQNREFNHSSNTLSVGYITGADLMIDSDTFFRVNGFDPNFFMYYEDTDLCYQVSKLGYKIKSIPQAKIIHYHGGSQEKKISLTENKKKKINSNLNSLNYYLSKNNTFYSRELSKIIYLLSYLIKIVLFTLFNNKNNRHLNIYLLKKSFKIFYK